MRQDMAIQVSSNTEEWYTPPEYIDLARQVLGAISLDPASAELPQTWIKAKAYFVHDGLDQPWWGSVWLNPPYGKTAGRSNQDIWTEKLEKEYIHGGVTQAIALINSRLGYKWYENICIKYPICLVKERIRFINERGEQGGQAKCGSTFLYMGSQWQEFSDTFKHLGRIIYPYQISTEYR